MKILGIDVSAVAKHKYVYLMLLPVVVYYALFHYVPMAGAVIAFKHYTPGRGIVGSPWVGLANFKDFFESVYLWRLVRNTITINLYELLLDTRGLRFPGLISHTAPPGGGTTDYAVEMYVEAVRSGQYTTYLQKGTFLDMMYMTDAIEAIVRLMEADAVRLIHRNAFNVTAMSVDPEMMAAAIRKYLPHFELGYSVDPIRQAIADQWPDRIDTTAAREEWNFQTEYDLDRMTGEMLLKLREVREGDSKIS